MQRMENDPETTILSESIGDDENAKSFTFLTPLKTGPRVQERLPSVAAIGSGSRTQQPDQQVLLFRQLTYIPPLNPEAMVCVLY